MAQKTYSRTRKEFVLECFSGAQFHSEPREAKLFVYHFTNVEITMVLVRKIREKYETVHVKNEIFKKYPSRRGLRGGAPSGVWGRAL